ncbi:probable 39S ribosomal protein L45, mitochondrial [Amphibalanus amphitrite]|uniref:probable 39S ribosomal protein L45, mitochondrial n=1 Tax=Amphibalanus amphitrite TaxID=1232801 RepID=UPI001C929A5F|nr:probable 39S ribosomal protein L45, mitochondrial [Amphibalanus amphitrite]XP_043194046.1 probable 39S ribosomal protein L45, mitochondrial [Amphibalanus amphitrite]XP_043194047.1 probable 39S ribosomal protein L45, mitochondrial [Amphibalanus amphitrite]XP_043194048.1 probable 39S ribosomal protein L45, mitochondrial [Amphibalanus amphitrite]XP_043194049.1 probable 39S ribosomal protein L45, mitochondrial [Amphibalanus amphitrite]
MTTVLKSAIVIGTVAKACRLTVPQQTRQILAAQLPASEQMRFKHWNPKFRVLRGKKIIKVELPNFNEDEEAKQLSPDEIRKKLKEKGMLPPRPWQERTMSIGCTGGVFEEYVPPEGDGKVSIVSTTGAKQRLTALEKKGKSMLSVRKIRSYDEEFDVGEFAEQAVEIYKAAHEALTARDKATLHANVTELAYPKMMQNVRHKTVRWQLLKSLEPPRVVHVRHTDILNKENVFAQVTVRLHTQQLLAIYDRFGRLMYGSEVVAKDVLEYVVFEKHLADEYGRWRIHSKVVPDWMPARDPVTRTWRKEPVPPPEEGATEPEKGDQGAETGEKAAAAAS